MKTPETESKPLEQNLEHLNILKPPLNTIRELKAKGVIGEKSPFWWNTDYEPDPREYMNFPEFKRRLVHFGIRNIVYTRFLGMDKDVQKRDVYLYPRPQIPMTIFNLEILEQNLPFMVTARPYHEKELSSEPLSSFLLKNKDLEKLKAELKVDKNKIIDLHQHFYPHIRGLFAGAKGTNLFWYPINVNSWYDILNTGINAKELQDALKKKNLDFLGFYRMPYSDRRTYHKVWEELSNSSLVSMNPQWPDFPSPSEVSVEEFVNSLNADGDRITFYPLRTPALKETLPIVVSTRTHEASANRKPTVLGVYAENKPPGYGYKAGILRIKNLDLAQFISSKISKDFGIPVDTVLFTPQKGRPKYERIPSI